MLALRCGFRVLANLRLPARTYVVRVFNKTIIFNEKSTHHVRLVANCGFHKHFNSILEDVSRSPYACEVKRFKHRTSKRSKQIQSSRTTEDENEEDDDEEGDNDDDDDSDFPNIHFKEDANLPVNFKELKTHFKSPRLDAIVSSGLGIARNQVDDIFYGSRLKLNGERLLKKSKQVKAGDYIDLIVSGETETPKMKRVRIVKISESRTDGGKLKIFLRAWRSPIAS